METNFFRKIALTDNKFKSYYVVWKLLQRYEKRQRKKSLNRTM